MNERSENKTAENKEKPNTVDRVYSKFTKQSLATVRAVSSHDMHLEGMEVALEYSKIKLFEDITAPRNFLLTPDQERLLLEKLYQAVKISDLHITGNKYGYITTQFDDEALLEASNFVNLLAGTKLIVKQVED